MQRALDPDDLLALAVPQGVLTAASRVATDHAPSLLAEAAVLGSVTSFRRNAFATSRRLARELVAEAGCEGAAIGRGADGAPIWPSGLCGSFSYKEEWCAVAVAKSVPGSALGIDVERIEDVPCHAWEDIVSPQELQRMSRHGVLPLPQLVNLAFTAKEAYFKAQCPITGDAELEFRDVELGIDSTSGQFSLAPLPPGLRVVARLQWSRNWCVAAVALQPIGT
ncbi:MAG: 4'-phosphopantetheinyl transferase superfamily protein [Bryobacterales bacterium]|nr:4'-phosphopantetheinyl transferase superfamily protein [Bryobacterales bacterium]